MCNIAGKAAGIVIEMEEDDMDDPIDDKSTDNGLHFNEQCDRFNKHHRVQIHTDETDAAQTWAIKHGFATAHSK